MGAPLFGARMVTSTSFVALCLLFLPGASTLAIGGLGSLKIARRPGRGSAPFLAAGGAGSYRVSLPKPLGIQFEEVAPGKPEGVVVAGLVEGGNAEANGRILVGDRLLRVSAVSFGGQSALVTLGSGQQYTSFKRELIPATSLDFDTIIAAIGSNEGRYGYSDVVLELRHTDESVPRATPTGVASPQEGVQWDAVSGTTNGGKSVPLRPPPDSF